MLRTPLIRLTANSKPLADLIMERLMTVSVTDNSSGDADELSITLDDYDGALQMPKHGVILQCWMGFSDIQTGGGLHDMGTFTVDSVEWGGTPDVITVKAKSADMKKSLKEGRSQSYHHDPLGTIAQQVAQRHQLILAMPPDLQTIDVGHIDQTDESDLHLLTRLCHNYGCAMTIKHGKLLIYRPSDNVSVSGQPLTLTTITRQTGDSFKYSVEDRQADNKNVTASYHDKKQGKRVTVGTGSGQSSSDQTGTTKKLKGNYKDAKSATAAAHAEKNRIKDKQAKFSITTAYGYPAITTESPVTLQGFKDSIDALKWTVDTATHTYSKSDGLTTELELVASLK